MNLYPLIETELNSVLGSSGKMKLCDTWQAFCEVYKKVKANKPRSMSELGILSELHLDTLNSKKNFYFAFQYRVKAKVDSETYNFYELVYCYFDLANEILDPTLKDDSIEVWESLIPFTNVLSVVEKWPTFKALKNLELNYKVFGDEV